MEEESKSKSTITIRNDKDNFKLESSDNSMLESLNRTPDKDWKRSELKDKSDHNQYLNQNYKSSKSNQWNGDISEIKESLQEGKEEENTK